MYRYAVNDSERAVVSAIVPMPAIRHDAPAVTSLLAGAAPEIREIIIVEGNSPASQRNDAAQISTGSFLYFLDDDAEVPQGTIVAALEAFGDPSVAAVGGPATTRSNARFVERLIGDIFESPFGAGTTLGRNIPLGSSARPSSGEDLHLCNLMIRRAAFDRSGGLKRGAYPGEDPELIRRLLRDGLNLVYEPRMMVRRARRSTVTAFSRQMFRYGAARAMHAFTAGSVPDALFTLPSLLLLYLAALVLGVGSEAGAIRELPLLCYGAFLAAGTFDASLRAVPISRALGALLLYPILHLSYGAGFLVGLSTRLRSPARRLSAKPA